MKFYKKANGEWVVDRYTLPAGTCEKDTHTETGAITITGINNGKVYADNVLPTEFQYPDPEHAGQFLKYATAEAFETAIEGFFFRVGGSGFFEFALTGTDGDFLNGERTGTVKAFNFPAQADVTKAMIAFDGLNFTKDYSLSVVNNQPVITFVNAPLANSYVFYQKK